jgi:hypothetical protein
MKMLAATQFRQSSPVSCLKTYLFRLFKNIVPSRIFKLKKEVITGGWRR